MKVIKKLLYILILLIPPSIGFGQNDLNETNFGRFSVNVALGNHTVGFPFQNLFTAFNPALSEIGISYKINKKQKHQWLIGMNTAFISNEVAGNSMKTGLALDYRYLHNSGIYGQIGIDLGSVRQSYPREQMIFDAETATYETTNESVTMSYSGFGLALGYDFEPKFDKRYAVFIGNDFYFQSPYFPTEAFPVLPQNILSIGTTIKFNSFKK